MNDVLLSDNIQISTILSNYSTSNLELEENSIFFKKIGPFFSLFTPNYIPLDVFKNVFHKKNSLLQITLETFKMESGFIGLMAILLIISIIPLCFTIYWCFTRSRSNIDELNIPAFINYDENIENDLSCSKRSLSFLLQVIVLLLILGVIAMFAINEQLSSTVDRSPLIVEDSLKDLKNFLKDVNQQIIQTLIENFNTATDRVKIDLEDIDKLLGEPIQKEISSITGIEVLFESILNICTVNTEIVQRVHLLRQTVFKAIQLSQEASSYLEELQIQLSTLQRQCNYRDRPLCDTLRLRNFDEIGILLYFRKLQTEPRLIKMLKNGEIEINGSQRNLTSELHSARSKFRNYPLLIQENSAKQQYKIIHQLTTIKDIVQMSSRSLTSTVQHLLNEIDIFYSTLHTYIESFHNLGNIFWVITISICVFTLFFTLILISGLSCACCNAENKAGMAFVISATMISFACTVLALFTVFILLLAGHGYVFLGQTLYDFPNYTFLEKLFDYPGIIYEHETTYGIFDFLLRPPGMDTKPFNVSLSKVLSNCEKGASTYNIFELEKLLNISTIININELNILIDSMDNVTRNQNNFNELTQNLELLLEKMLQDSQIDLKKIRNEISQPTPEKDIATFTDQMQRVSIQIQDIATASRMTTLGSRARRLQTNYMQPLEQLRSDVIYHLTALELQRNPWQQQINQTLLHLKTIKFFMNEQAKEICYNRSQIYINRLKSHMDNNFKQTSLQLNNSVASCKPIYDIFNVNRVFVCHKLIDPVIGLGLFSFLCLVLWVISTPFQLRLASIHKQLENIKMIPSTQNQQISTNISSISNHSNWTTSGETRILQDIDRKIEFVLDENKQTKSNSESETTCIYLNEDLNREFLI